VKVFRREVGSSEPPTIDLGKRVRDLRAAVGLTLTELNLRSGIARSTLSKIENNRLSPTYETLVKLAHGLGVNIESLFSDAMASEPVGRRSITRRGEGRKHTTHAYDYEMLCSDIYNKKIIPIRATVKAHTREEFGDLIAHDGEEIIFVISGAIELHTAFYEPVLLKAGDCVFFDSRMAHACTAHGVEDAEVLWVCSDDEAIDVMKRGAEPED